MQQWQMNLGGRPLVIENGKLAKQASNAVLVRYGDTVVLVTATMAAQPRQGIDFFPLLVDYEERLYSVGKIPGGFIKREGRPAESAILAGRSIDRPIRPLFPEGFRNDVQVVATVLSVDRDNEPDITAMIGASAALTLSEVPFYGPIGGVHVGRVDGQFIINPTVSQAAVSDIDLLVAGTKDAVMMVEAGAKEVSEHDMLEAILFGHEAIKELVTFQEKIQAEVGKEKFQYVASEIPEEIGISVREKATALLAAAVRGSNKQDREAAIANAKEDILRQYSEEMTEQFTANEPLIRDMLDTIIKEEVRKMITVERTRPDGRKLDEIRKISCEVGVLPRVHGSGLFTRGQTQVLSVATLGAISDEQILDGIGEAASKRYIHHYNFPAFSVGEVRPMRGPGRREIGHGALAERALLPMIPAEADFPYTIRVVSEVLESNGSTSQASICGSTLSLMDAGVPIKKPVAGVAMGLVKYGEDFAILTDIQGMEDALGDMDFKVAGTDSGITAIQMDIKVKGINRAILEQALEQARQGRLFILDRMRETISQSRPDISPYAPRMLTMEIDPDKIRDVIGPGGKTIRKIIEETGVTIDIQDDGHVFIGAVDHSAGEKAMTIITNLTKDPEVGEVYDGKVTRLMNFGAFVEILPGKEGLVHISQLDLNRVAKVEDVVSAGDPIRVKVIEIDRQGRINLSRKALLGNEPANPIN